MDAVGYCRADLASGASASLAEQKERITAEITRREWNLTEIFQDTGSAHSLREREGLESALRAVESRRARALVVTDLTRLSTTLDGIAWLVRASGRRAWKLVSMADQVDGEDPAPWSPCVTAAVAPVIQYVTFDCHDPDALATFWSAATGYRKEASPDPGAYAVVSDLDIRTPALWFNKVPEPKIVKNRVHICLNAQSLTDEVERLTALGADKYEEHSSSSGSRWVVMTDPEGNEFCLVAVSRA